MQTPEHARTPRAFERGFTMTELLVVISIIALISAAVLPEILGGREKAWVAACEDNLGALLREIQNELDTEVARGNADAAEQVLDDVVPRHAETNPRNRSMIAYVDNGSCSSFVPTATTSCQVFFCFDGATSVVAHQYEQDAARSARVTVQ